MHSIRAWEIARSPNYITNVDKKYPYSEVPHIGKYKLVKIPIDTPLIPLVDYWGEGRINSEAGISGFPDSYNVNHPYQCVSNGPDRGRKIPNRIPVQSYTTCDTSSYIKDDSVNIVTLMGAPINNSCAKDIRRMINKNIGVIVVYNFDRSSADIRNLEAELLNTGFTLCTYYKLPAILKGLTLFDSSELEMVNNSPAKLKDNLRNAIVSAEYENAVKQSKVLTFSSYSEIISTTITDLMRIQNKNLCSFAYQLWNNDAQNVVIEHFPEIFHLILNQKKVKFISRKNNQAIKMDANFNAESDRLAWGDAQDQTSNRMSWLVIPNWDNNRVIFRLLNVDCGMFLKLSLNTDSYNDRAAFGAYGYESNRHYWYLDPVIDDDKLLFFIVNVEYSLGLKLDANVDSYGDRQLWGHSHDVHNNPSYFGWFILPWH